MNNLLSIEELITAIRGSDIKAAELAEKRQHDLIKPAGSLGELEKISIKIAGITGQIKNKFPKKLLVLFAADNGVYEEGVSATPQYFTKLLTLNYAKGCGCAINVICDSCCVDLKLVDMGIIGGAEHENIDDRNLMINGTFNFINEPAMGLDITRKALLAGVLYAEFAKKNGYGIIAAGECGMGNTTTSTACIMALLGAKNVDKFVGRGGGLTDEAFDKKKQVIAKALDKYEFDKCDALNILSTFGGLDIAAMAGLYLGGAYYRLPVVLDGVISTAAALTAYRLAPSVRDYMLASHVSEEPAYSAAIDELSLKPILNLGMRLGEGSGAPIAMKVIDTALDVINNMSTFSELNAESNYRKDIKMK